MALTKGEVEETVTITTRSTMVVVDVVEEAVAATMLVQLQLLNVLDSLHPLEMVPFTPKPQKEDGGEKPSMAQKRETRMREYMYYALYRTQKLKKQEINGKRREEWRGEGEQFEI